MSEDRTRRLIVIVFAVLYAAMALIAFGHSASSSWRACQIEQAQAEASKHVAFCGKDYAAVGGVLAGMLWPLYWSWEAQSHDA